MGDHLPISGQDKQRWAGNTITPYITEDGYLVTDIEEDVSDEVRENYFTGKIRYAVYTSKIEKVVFLLIKVGTLAWIGFPAFLEAKKKKEEGKRNPIIIRLMLAERGNQMPFCMQKYNLPEKKQEYLEACAEIIEDIPEKDYLERCRKIASELDDTRLAMLGIAQETEYFECENIQLS